MYSQDWVMRQIEILVQFIARTIFGKTTIEYVVKDENAYTESDLLHGRLKELLAEGRICEAEDLLFNSIDSENVSYLEVAVDFYQSLNRLTDEELSAANFSREEISEGLASVIKKYNVNTGLREEG